MAPKPPMILGAQKPMAGNPDDMFEEIEEEIFEEEGELEEHEEEEQLEEIEEKEELEEEDEIGTGPEIFATPKSKSKKNTETITNTTP